MPEQPDRLELALQTLFDLVETYGGERLQQQQEMWGSIEDAMEELADAGITEGRRQATEGWEREWGVWSSESPGVPAGVGGDRFAAKSEAREEAEYLLGLGWAETRVVSRLVGPWEPAPVSASDAPASDLQRGSDG